MKKALVVFLVVFSLQLNLSAESFNSASTVALEDDFRKGSNYSKAMEFKAAVKAGKLAERTDKALNTLIAATVTELKKRKHVALSNEIKAGWAKHEGFLVRSELRGFDDIGDHEAIKFLADIHEKIHFVLGDDICRALRTHDLFIFAYCIPVVFRCVDNVGSFEYERHFIPLCKVTSYWISIIICSVATMGMGSVTFLCGIGSMLVEQAVGMFVAPALVDNAYGHFCKHLIIELPGQG